MDLTRLLESRVPMDVRCRPMADREGRDCVVVVAKMTWNVSPRGQARIARPVAPVVFADQPRPGGRFSSLRRASDAVEEKPGTDVILVGTAHPQQPDVTEQVVSLRVESGQQSLHKALTVYGPRVWHPSLLGLAPGPAGKLEPTPLVYELAYGGFDETDAQIEIEMRNPSGTGYMERKRGLVGRPAPVIEDRRFPLSGLSPAPAGFGPIPAHWSPRREHMGTYDDRWRTERAPLRPVDFDVRHHSSAPPDQWLSTPLLGDEAIEVLGATPAPDPASTGQKGRAGEGAQLGGWRFRLPRYSPQFHVIVRGETTVLDPHLDTLLIDADAANVELTWRIKVALPRKTEHLEKIIAFGTPPLPEHIVADLAARVPGFGAPEEP